VHEPVAPGGTLLVISFATLMGESPALPHWRAEFTRG